MARKPAPPTKKYVDERIAGSYLDLEGPIDEAIAALTKAKAMHGVGYDHLFLENEQDCGCYGDCGCKATLKLYGRRWETDKEFDTRVAADAERAAAQEARDRMAYEELFKRFGKGGKG